MTALPQVLIAGDTLSIDELVKSAIKAHPQEWEGLIVESHDDSSRSNSAELSPPRISFRWDEIPHESTISGAKERRVGISQEIDFPAKYIWRSRMANFALERERLGTYRTARDALLELKLLVLRSWSLQAQTLIISEYVDTLKLLNARIVQSNRLEEYSRLEVGKFELDLKVALASYESLKRTASESRSLLGDYIGADRAEYVIAEPIIEPFGANPRGEQDVTGTANPELQAEQANLNRSQARLSAARWDWLPDFTLSYYDRTRLDKIDRDAWAFELEMSVPVWYWLGKRTEQEIAKTELRRARTEYEAVRINSLQQSMRYRQEYVIASDKLSFLRAHALPYAVEAYRMTKEAFAAGGSDFEDLLDAWKDLNEKRLEEIDLIFEAYRASLMLNP